MIATLALAAVLTNPQMQMDHSSMHMNPAPALRTGLGDIHHPVSTKNKLAQKFFAQGLALSYGFNHHASIASFEEAARLDPNLAMAHWGKAYAMGMNINLPIDAATNKAANEEAQKAVGLKDHANAEEKDLIDALAQRYSNDDNPDFDKLNTAYAHAMANVASKYPNDPDVQSMYAESLMDLHPWRYWTIDGMPGPDTQIFVSVLQNTLKKYPNHIGANHFLIHALEASPHPELALDAAHRLEKLAPQSGHLVHMPSHIYLRMGIWDRGLTSNEKALAVDEKFLSKTPDPGVYPMYYVHNFDMYRAVADMAGNYEKASWAMHNVVDKAGKMGPMGDPFTAEIWTEMVRFNRWNDILSAQAPVNPLDPTQPPSSFVQAEYHFARGMAFASTKQIDDAQKEYDAFVDLRSKTPAEYAYGFTPASDVYEVEANILGARLMKARGEHAMEIDLLNKAVATYDKIGYDEPADFYFPVRESLGFAQLRANRHADAVATFREEVKRHPNSGRALFGLWKSLMLTGPMSEADKVQHQYEKAWKLADTQLFIDEL